MASFGLTPQKINYGGGRSLAITNNGARAQGLGNVAFSGQTAGTQYLDRNNLGGIKSGVAGGIGGAAGAAGGSGVLGGYGASRGIGANLQADLDRANAANEARYQEALGLNQSGGAAQQANLKQGYSDLYAYGDANKAEQMGLVSQIGGAARVREQQATARQLGSSSQSLTGRGLGNSTVVDSVNRGIADDSALRNRELDEADAGRKLGVSQHNGDQGFNARQRYADSSTGLMGDLQSQRLGIIGSKVDQGPNIGAYQQALGQQGAFGGANAYRPNSPVSSGQESQQRYADQVQQAQGGRSQTQSSPGFQQSLINQRNQEQAGRLRQQQLGQGIKAGPGTVGDLSGLMGGYGTAEQPQVMMGADGIQYQMVNGQWRQVSSTGEYGNAVDQPPSQQELEDQYYYDNW